MPLIAFSSPKGGVGKTTLAAHMGAILRRRGHRVLAIDLDPQNALRLHLGLPISAEQGFMNRFDQSPAWREAVIRTPAGVDLLPYGAVDPRRAMEINAFLFATPERLSDCMRDMLSEPGLIVLVDMPPGPNPALEALLPLIDLICLVLLADAGSAAMMPAVATGQVFGRGTLAGRFVSRMGVVMNQVDFDLPLSAAVMDCAERALGPRLLGAVCRDEAVAEALASKRLLTEPGLGAADDLQILADRITARLNLPQPAAASGMGFSALSDWGLR